MKTGVFKRKAEDWLAGVTVNEGLEDGEILKVGFAGRDGFFEDDAGATADEHGQNDRQPAMHQDVSSGRLLPTDPYP